MEVSVIIPCYNGQDFVADAVRSVLRQTFADLECIVVDDASTDGSLALLRTLAAENGRLRVLSMPKNSGPSACRNVAIDEARGRWITLLDADDLYEPDRIEKLVAVAREKDADLVIDNQSVRYFGSDEHAYTAFLALRGKETIHVSQEMFFDNSRRIGLMNFGYMKPLFSAEFLRRHGIRYNEAVRVSEDFLLYAECVANTSKFYAVPYNGYIYRRRRTSLSMSRGDNLTPLAHMCDELLARLGPKLTPQARRGLTERKHAILRHIDYRSFRDLLKRKSITGAAGLLAKRPALLLTTANFFRRRYEQSFLAR